MASLAEQKEHTLRLVGKVDELAGGLGDMEVRSDGTGSVLVRNVQRVPVGQGGRPCSKCSEKPVSTREVSAPP